MLFYINTYLRYYFKFNRKVTIFQDLLLYIIEGQEA